MHIPDPGVGAKSFPLAVLTESGRVSDSGIPHDVDELLPLVDSRILEDLEDQLNGSEFAQRFARDYAAMWDERRRRVAAAVQGHDRVSALDTIISLKITSAMVGGLRLARLAEVLEAVIRQGDFRQGQAMMGQVTENGNRTVSELRANYILKSA
jgi:hypothetical protein